jgi:hypothetical protein
MIPYEFSLLIALAAMCYSYILTEPNAILNGVYKKLYKLFRTDEREEAGLPIHPLFMVLIYCEKCVAGQWALWLFFWYAWPLYVHEFCFLLVLKHIFFILFTIILAGTSKNIYIIINNQANK